MLPYRQPIRHVGDRETFVALPSQERGNAMGYYRLYFMDNFHGHIERFEELECVDDQEAIAVAEAKRGPLALELWCSQRKVARVEAIDLASQLLARRRESNASKDQDAPMLRADPANSENRSA